MTDEAIQTHYGRDTVMATVRRQADAKVIEYKLSDFPVAEKLEKFMEDVKYGIYPLTAFALSQPPPAKTRAVTPEGPNESAQSVTPEPLEPEDRWGVEFKCYVGPPVPAPPSQLTMLSKLCDGMNRQMQATVSFGDTPEYIAYELLEHAIINWRDVPSIAKLMTLAYIQRANETAEYLAANETHTVAIPDEMTSANAVPEPPPPDFTPTAGVLCPQPPSEVESTEKPGQEAEAQEAAAQEDDVFEDPTLPQPLEGRLAGLEPIIGTPQMTLAEAVAAGTTHGGLHFPKDRLKFTGVVAEIEHRLEMEIIEWQKRMQEYLVEVALQQQQQQQQLLLQQQQQNGAQQQQQMFNEVDENHEQDQGINVVEEVRQ